MALHAIRKYLRIQSSWNNTDIPISAVLPEGIKCWQFITYMIKCCSIWIHRFLWNFNCFNYVNKPLITTPFCRNSNTAIYCRQHVKTTYSVKYNPCTLVLIFIVFMLLIDIKVFKRSILVSSQGILMLFCVFVCLSVCLSVCLPACRLSATRFMNFVL